MSTICVFDIYLELEYQYLNYYLESGKYYTSNTNWSASFFFIFATIKGKVLKWAAIWDFMVNFENISNIPLRISTVPLVGLTCLL